jgi:SAM-dependent methyltransferase
MDGTLTCSSNHAFPIREGIPRFVPRDNYANSFGFQWKRFARTQLDDELLQPISRHRFFEETRWPKRLNGQLILEAGAGAGRFTPHAASTGATVVSVDFSEAIDVARRNNRSLPNVHYVQADIRRLPLRDASFDKVYCFGVLQHTPDPKAAFEALLPVLKSGGEIIVDIYRLSWKTLLTGKYYLRPITTRVPARPLFGLVSGYVRLLYPVLGVLHRVVGRRARALSTLFAIADYRGVFNLPGDRLYELSVLDTFDGLSPAHDHPQTIRAVQAWLRDSHLIDTAVQPGFNGIEARGRMR